MKTLELPITFTKAQLDSLFPFHVLMNRDLMITGSGPSLNKLIPALQNNSFERVFAFKRPAIKTINYQALASLENTILILQCLHESRILIKGQILRFSNEQLLFVGSPLITKTNDVDKLNLSITDFAIHNQTSDMLQVLSTADVLMEEVNELVNNLNEQKEDLNITSSRLSSLIMNLNSAVLLEDENRKILLANHEFCSIFNIPVDPSQLIGMDCTDSSQQSKHLFKHEQEFIDRVETLITTRTKCIGELIELKNGTVLQRDFIPIYKNENYLGHLWIYTDVTQKVKSDKLIKESEDKYKRIIENFDLGLLEVDIENKITKVYSGFCKMTGFTESELIGRRAIELLAGKKDQQIMKSELGKRAEGEASVYEVQIKTKSGKKIWILISGAPIFDENNKIIGSIGIHKDITSQKEREISYKKSMEAAEESTRIKKQFLANVSHEVRTPIHGIRGLSEMLLQSDQLTNETKEDLASIHYSANHLLSIVQDLLDIAKIDSGKASLEERNFNVKNTLLELAHNHKHLINEKKLDFIFKLDPEIPQEIHGDENKLIQVLNNILNNSYKFTSHGSIHFEVNYGGIINNEHCMVFQIRDTGIGIPQNKIKKVFESFEQANNEHSRTYGGTGLGLAITKSLIELMKGSITVNSVEGKGTYFKIEIPFSSLQKNKRDVTNKTDISFKHVEPFRILVAEDNPINQKLLQRQLESLPTTNTFVNNGKELLDALNKHKYDLILMDVQMPEMDGYSATKKIREHANTGISQIKIIGLSAHASYNERTKAMNAGMNDFLGKPFTENEVKQKIFKQITGKDSLVSKPKSKKPATKFSLNYIKEICNNDPAFIKEMIRLFITETPDVLKDLENAIQENNLKTIAFFSHKLKGSVKIFSASKLIKQLNEMEGKANQKSLSFNYAKSYTPVLRETNILIDQLSTINPHAL